MAQFASRYGQTATAITALESYLHQYGIATSAYPDDLDVTASGTAAEFDSALSVQQEQYKVPAVAAQDGLAAIPAQQVHGTAAEPVPARRHRPGRAGHPRADRTTRRSLMT